MKKLTLKYIIGYCLFLLLVFFISSCDVKADVIKYKFWGVESISDSVKNTYFNPNETNTYSRDYVLFNGSERFFSYSYCGTGFIDFAFPNDYEGVTSLVGYSTGGSCFTQGRDGYVYSVYFVAKQVNDAGNGNLSLLFNTLTVNNNSYDVYITGLNLLSVSSIPAGVRIPTYDGEFTTLNTKIDTVEQAIEEVKKAQSETLTEQKKTNEELKKTNDTLTDDSIDTSKTQIEDKSADASKSPISSLLTLPLKILGNINTGLSGACSPFSLGTMFGTELILPCINLENRLGTWLWGLIDSFFCIFLIYNVGMLAVKIWTDVIMMKDFFSQLYKPDSEKGDKKE